MAKVGLTYNLIPLSRLKESPLDSIAEYDTLDTIQAIADALRVRGHDVIPMEADEGLVEQLKKVRPEIVFNIAEGLRNASREAHVPAICEMMNIPYTGSGVLTLALCQDKARTNEVLTYHGVQVPSFQVFHSPQDDLSPDLMYPLIVKLLHEGSSMGLSEKSVVENPSALREQVAFLLQTYHEPALVQRFIQGREFTVGILGNRRPVVLPATEVVFQDTLGIVLFELDADVIPLVESTLGANFFQEHPLRKKVRYTSVCPASIPAELCERINQTVLRAFRVMNCSDWCRIDLRLGNDDQLYVLELNPIAGISPGYWLPNSARFANLDYSAFINRILDIALDRIGGQGKY
jgi:D-alanine-D-alanine ligase-like ATP-grasp enzyme